MVKNMDQEKHYLAILIENDLYRVWETYEGDIAKQNETIEKFVKQYGKNYKTMNDLIRAIDDYIKYYNYDRIKEKLKGLSPVNYRLQSSN